MDKNGLYMKILFFLFLIFLLGIVSMLAWGSPKDFCQDYRSAQFFLSGKQAYAPVNCGKLLYNVHPPFTILIFVPFAMLSLPLATLIWSIFSFFCYLLAGLLLLKIVGWLSYRNCLLFIILSGLWPAFFAANADHNISPVLLLLLVISWWQQRKGKFYAAGIMIGVASLLRPWFFILLVGLFLNKKHKQAFLGVLTITAGIFLSFLLLGSTAYVDYFGPIRVYEYNNWLSHPLNLSLIGAFTKISLLLPNFKLSYTILLGELFSLLLLIFTLLFILLHSKQKKYVVVEHSQALLISIIFLTFPLSWGWNLIIFLIPCAFLILAFRHLTKLPRGWYFLLGIGFLSLLDPSEFFVIYGNTISHALGEHFISVVSFVVTLQTIGIFIFFIAQVIIFHTLYTTAARGSDRFEKIKKK